MLLRRQLSLFLSSRLAAVAAICTFSILLGIAIHNRGSVPAGWAAVRIPALNRTFGDTRTVTNAIDCVNAGQDPYIVRSFDPWRRTYNYPPIWLELRHLGVTGETTNLIGISLAIIAIAAVLTLFSSRGWVAGILTYLSVLGWPLLWGVERGNIDVLVFGAAVFGFLLIRGRGEFIGRAALIIVLTVLKVYPVVMAVVFLRQRNGWWRMFAVAAIAIVALVATSGHALQMVFRNTPHDAVRSFGAMVTLALATGHALRPEQPQRHLQAAAACLAIALAGSAIWFGCRRAHAVCRFLPRLDVQDRFGALAVAGLAVYCFSFVLGANYDYRLMYLLLPLAFVLRGLSKKVSVNHVPVALLLIGYQLSLYKNVSHVPYMIDPLVFVVACVWLGESLLGPGFKKQDLRDCAVAH